MIMVSLSILNCAIHRACNFIMGREMHLCRFGPGWFRRARLLKNAFAKQQLAMGLLRLGFLANFLSHPVG